MPKTLYLCGNSLGLQPKGVKENILNQLEKWGNEGRGTFCRTYSMAINYDIVKESTAKLVGAERKKWWL